LLNVRFEWDELKNTANYKKHNISFNKAMTVFDDPNVIYKPDPDHSIIEERFIVLLFSDKLRILVVCHCYHECDSVIRIISARKATTNEANQYRG
jgi:uncharacterized DUF497 family protein